MSLKRKISIRKVLQVFVTLVVTSSCIVAVLGASQRQEVKMLNEIDIYVTNGSKYQFLDKQELWNDLITKKDIKEHKTPLSKLNLRELEAAASVNPWVAKAQAYVDNQSNLHINVTQRVPVARIFYRNGESLYLDTSLSLLPLSDMFTHYTTIVTNVPAGLPDSTNKALRSKIITLVKFIERDTFWSSQIDQVVVNDHSSFELIPVLGSHKILMGDTTDLKYKFENLFAFYKDVLNKIGWDKYDVLDVRYRDQIVASPSLPWKAPSKNALSNMDWLKSIMGEAPKEQVKLPTSSTVTMPALAKARPEPKPAAAPKANPVVMKQEPKPVAKAKPEKKTTQPKESEKETSVQPKAKYIFKGSTTN